MGKNINNGNKCYVYMHIREDNNQPFYIGIGSKPNFKRAFQSSGRNFFWHKIVNQYPCISNVIYTDLSWKEACEIEINLISHFGRRDNNTGILCNLTDGGEGNLGTIFSEERKNKISKALTGKKTSEEHKRKCRERRQTPETIEKIRKQKIGRKASKETIAKMKITNMKGINAAAAKISKVVYNTENGIFYNSVTEALKSIGVTKSHLSGMLLGRYSNWTNLKYG